MSLTHIPSSTEDANTFMEEGILVDEAVPQRLDAPKWIRTFGFKIPLAIFAITLLCFGGVHGKVLYSGQIALFLSAAIVLLGFSLNSSVSQSYSFGGISKTVGLLLVWATLAPLLIQAYGPQSNILAAIEGAQSNQLDRVLDYSRFALYLAAFCAVIRLAIKGRAVGALHLVIGIQVAVALIALSSWLYDNGKLFGVFAPDYVFTSTRARWPFVNADHLGHFLVPAVFLILAETRIRINRLTSFMKQYEPAKKHGFSAYFSSKRFQKKSGRVAILLVSLLIVALAISGCLSRAAWLAVSIGVILFLLVDYIAVQPMPEIFRTGMIPLRGTVENPGKKFKKRRSSRQAQAQQEFWNQFGRRITRPLLVLLAAFVFYTFLNEKGQELVGARIEYGLLHSKEDIRWAMYHDTLPVIQDNLWLGVGIGNWEPYFLRAMNPLMAGINPVYLHSDPLQFLTETGLLGTAPIVLLGVLATVLAIRRMKALDAEQGTRLAAIVVGIWAGLIASCFDFPFRIPAIAIQFAILLALLCSAAEDEEVPETKVMYRKRTREVEPTVEDLMV